jgi:hypothetical protein
MGKPVTITLFFVIYRPDGSVGIATKLRAGQLKNRGVISGRGVGFSFHHSVRNIFP